MTVMSRHLRREGRKLCFGCPMNRTVLEGNNFGASGCMPFKLKGILRFEVTGIHKELVTCKGK